MYLARYGDGTAEVVHAAVCLAIPLVTDDETREWHDAFCAEARHLVEGAEFDFAIRMGIQSDGFKRQIHMIGPSTAEADIRAMAARLSRLNRVIPGTVEICESRDEHDALTTIFPNFRITVDTRPFAAGEGLLPCDFRLVQHADALLHLATEQFSELQMQFNVRRCRPSPDALRAMKRNLLRIEEELGIPERLKRSQAELALRFESASFLVAEYLGVRDLSLYEAASAALNAAFHRVYGSLGYAGSPIEDLSPNAQQFEIETGLHPTVLEPEEPLSLIGQAQDERSVLNILTWQPSAELLELLRPKPVSAAAAGRRLKVFVSYSHKDRQYRDALATSLSLLRRQQIIEDWTDQDIAPGTEWRAQIHRRLEEADIIVLLVSGDFIASEFCYDVEMRRALERHQAGTARVIPIVVRATDLHGAPFMEVQALPRDAKPVALWSDADEAWAQIASSIRRVAHELARS